jgi:hypothetical protein
MAPFLTVIPRRPQADEGSGRGPELGRGATDTEQRDCSAPPLQRDRAACAWPASACISATFRPARSIISALLASHLHFAPTSPILTTSRVTYQAPNAETEGSAVVRDDSGIACPAPFHNNSEMVIRGTDAVPMRRTDAK